MAIERLEIRNALKRYGKRVAVRSLSAVFEEGKINALVGKNGSGKTTSIKMLLGLVRPTHGEIIINNTPLERFLKKNPNTFGFLPEQVRLPQNTNIREMIYYLGLSKNVSKHDCQKEMEYLAGYFELDLNAKLRGGEISHGMARKVGLINALIHKPSCLVLDEPTNALDPIAVQALFDLLRRKKKEGLPIIISSHHLSELEGLADVFSLYKQNQFVGQFRQSDFPQSSGLKNSILPMI
jgi:ABC-2 type transport system ATP-binding protein